MDPADAIRKGRKESSRVRRSRNREVQIPQGALKSRADNYRGAREAGRALATESLTRLGAHEHELGGVHEISMKPVSRNSDHSLNDLLGVLQLDADLRLKSNENDAIGMVGDLRALDAHHEV